MSENYNCQICGNQAMEYTPVRDSQIIDCPICGNYEITGRASMGFKQSADKYKSAKVSHWIRKHFNGKNRVLLTEVLLEELFSDFQLPNPMEQADIFINWLGQNTEVYGTPIKVDYINIAPIMGSINEQSVMYVIQYLMNDDYIHNYLDSSMSFEGYLTFKGWERFEKLKRSNKESRLAFMAMKFGDSTLDKVFNNIIKDAVDKTGFEIRKLDEEKRAGLIDDKLRVEIRRSKFLIADLTHDNNGAYWEAGFAEGLGIPVIYICEKMKFKERKTHFDTNHHLTLQWKDDPESLQHFADNLKATIRATFPNDAIMED